MPGRSLYSGWKLSERDMEDLFVDPQSKEQTTKPSASVELVKDFIRGQEKKNTRRTTDRDLVQKWNILRVWCLGLGLMSDCYEVNFTEK